MSQNSILVVGSLNMDQVVRIPRIPALGETLLGADSPKLVPGGKGANQAVAMARLGAGVAMAGRVGSDPFGQRLLQALRADKVNTDLVVVDQEETSGVAFIFLTPDGNNAIVVASGANMRVGADPAQLARISRALTGTRALVLQLEIPEETVNALITAGQAAGIPVILNAAPARPLAGAMLRQLAALIVNETEALAIEASLVSKEGMNREGEPGTKEQPSGRTAQRERIDTVDDARMVATALHEHGIPRVVITLGARGALLVGSDETGKARSIYQPAPVVQVVDTTAAGDCFVGALAVALTEGQSEEDALRFAIDASALKVTRFGAQSGLPTREEVEAFQRTSARGSL